MLPRPALTAFLAVLAVPLIVYSAESPAASPAAQWNQFRGPRGSGVVAQSDAPAVIETQRAAWAVDVPPGLSSPVLSDSLVVLTGLDGDRLVTLAFEKQHGRLLWRQSAPEVPLEFVHETSSPVASTPYVDENCIYVYFGSYGLLCYDHDGILLWQKAIPTPKSLYGMATSPIVHEDRLILVLDDDANLPDSQVSRSKIIALDKSNGELIWETPRPFYRSGWSTPTIWRLARGDELVVLGSGRLCGYDAASGTEKWFVNGFSRETVSRPIVGPDFVYASASMLGGVADEQPDPLPFWHAVMRFDHNHDQMLQRDEMTRYFTFPFRPELPIEHPGFGLPLPKSGPRREQRLDAMFASIDKDRDGFWTRQEFLENLTFNRGKPNLVAVRPGGQGDVSESHVSWALHRNVPEIPSPLLFQDRIYLVRDGGILSSVDALDGHVIYRQRLGPTGHYRASPVVAGQHLYAVSQQGFLSVVQVGDDFQILHQFDLGEQVSATPAIDASTIYIRTQTKLFAFRGD